MFLFCSPALTIQDYLHMAFISCLVSEILEGYFISALVIWHNLEHSYSMNCATSSCFCRALHKEKDLK